MEHYCLLTLKSKGNIMTKTIEIGECIADKFKVRYADMDEKEFGSSNMVIDAYYPNYIRRSLLNMNVANSLSARASAISPFIANELGVYQIQIEDLTKMLGFKKQDIKAILNAVKSKDINLVLIGLGGTGMNFMHWATELCNYANTINIFNSIQILEDDMLDITNIPRFPQNISNRSFSENADMQKINLIDDVSVLSKTKIKKFNTRFNEGTFKYLYLKHDNHVFYGAPDIKTRELFSKVSLKDKIFISGTHGNDDCQLYIRPVQNSDLQVESYGMINLSVFFMNQIKLTIEFLKLLGSNEDLLESRLIMEYSFSKEYKDGNILRAGLNRTYNFPIQEQSFMLEDDIQPLEPEASEEEDEWEIALDTSNQEQDSVAISTVLVEEYLTETRPDVRAYNEQQRATHDSIVASLIVEPIYANTNV
jgi:hypothetical protein